MILKELGYNYIRYWFVISVICLMNRGIIEKKNQKEENLKKGKDKKGCPKLGEVHT